MLIVRTKKWMICLFFLSSSMLAQEIDSLLFSTISKQLVNQHNLFSSNEADNKDFERREDCIYIKEEDYLFGCVSSYWDINWTTDFDSNAIDDLVIKIAYKGAGRGDNISEYHYKIVTLNSDRTIKKIYALYGGEIIGSRGLLSIDSTKNGILYATFKQNSMRYGPDNRNLERVSLQFFIKNNRIKEKYYKKCTLSKIDKTIFKNDIGFDINKSFSFDEAYNEKQLEKIHLKDSSYYTAFLSGCETINVSFTYNQPKQIRRDKAKTEVKNIWLKHIGFLAKNTKYEAVLKELEIALSKLNSEKIILRGYLDAQLEIYLSDQWKANLNIAFNNHYTDDISIQLMNSSDEESFSFWKSVERKVNGLK